MPFYMPRFSTTGFTGVKGILASEHLQYLEAGATLDSTAFDVGEHKPGKLIARNLATGKFEPFTVEEGFDNFSILEYGFNNDGENDLIAGAVLVRASVYEAKIADTVSAEFKALVPMIRFVTHK